MLYEMSLESADGAMVLAWCKADSAEAFRIADAFAAHRSEPLAMLCVCHTDSGQHACAWKVYPLGWVQDSGSEDALDDRRKTFLAKVNDIFEHYGRNV